MTDAPPILECGDVIAMARHMRARAEELGIPRRVLDDMGFLPTGFAEKALADPPLKRLGPETMFPMAWVLGFKIALVVDEAATNKLRKVPRRREPQALSGKRHWRYGKADARAHSMIKEMATRTGLEGARVAFDNMTAEQRIQRASYAATTRWKRWRQARAAEYRAQRGER